jgi:hypothetical protein
MTRLKPGDRIDCRVKSATIVSPYNSYDEIKTFEIIATDDNGYYLYVPHYYYLKGTGIADSYRCKTLKIDSKFLNENMVYIKENLVAAVQTKLDGMFCKICKEFYPYSEPNQRDGSLICFSCRGNPYH